MDIVSEPILAEATITTEDEIEITNSNYNVVVNVSPEKIPYIKSEVIDGKKFIMIPLDENEQANVNGDELFTDEI